MRWLLSELLNWVSEKSKLFIERRHIGISKDSCINIFTEKVQICNLSIFSIILSFAVYTAELLKNVTSILEVDCYMLWNWWIFSLVIYFASQLCACKTVIPKWLIDENLGTKLFLLENIVCLFAPNTQLKIRCISNKELRFLHTILRKRVTWGQKGTKCERLKLSPLNYFRLFPFYYNLSLCVLKLTE